jgi:hypothetical protein
MRDARDGRNDLMRFRYFDFDFDTQVTRPHDGHHFQYYRCKAAEYDMAAIGSTRPGCRACRYSHSRALQLDFWLELPLTTVNNVNISYKISYCRIR